jgi:hypothetical protein
VGRSGNQPIARTIHSKFHVAVSTHFIGGLTGSPIPKWWKILKYFHVFMLPVSVIKFETEERCHLSQQNSWLPTSICWLRTSYCELLTWFAENLKYSLTADFICWLLTCSRWLQTSTCWRQARYFVHWEVRETPYFLATWKTPYVYYRAQTSLFFQISCKILVARSSAKFAYFLKSTRDYHFIELSLSSDQALYIHSTHFPAKGSTGI